MPQGFEPQSCRLQPRAGTLKIGPLAILIRFQHADQFKVWLYYTSILLIFYSLDFPFEDLLS